MTRFFDLVVFLLPTSLFAQISSTSLDVPVFTTGPDRSGGDGAIAFDQRILVQISGSSQAAEMCLYLNIRTADTGIQYGKAGELGVCALNPNDRKFTFMLVRASGQVNNYTTIEKNGELKRYVSTGNTERFAMPFPRLAGMTLLRLGPAGRGGVATRAYRANGSSPTFYIHGRSDP